MKNDSINPGGFTPYTCKISTDAQDVWDEAMKNSSIIGKNYEPVAVAQQMVAGVNYRFFCNAHIPGANPFHEGALVSVFKPLPGEGNAEITAIQEVPFNQ